MRICGLCGKDETTTRIIKNKKKGLMCDACYQRDRLNPYTYTPSEYGDVSYDPDGKPICHICGKAYDKLLAHVWQVHKLSAYDYKIEFGLDVGKGIMSKESTELARKRVYENFDASVVKPLIEGGKKTRFKVGESSTKYLSEQSKRRLIAQLRKHERRGKDDE